MTEKPMLSRRTVAAGAAWSIPVVAASSQLPAYAASGVPVCTSPSWYQIGRSANQPCASFTGSYAASTGTSYSGNGGVDWNNGSTSYASSVTSTVSTSNVGPVSLVISQRTVQGVTSGTWGSGTTNASGCGATQSCTVTGVASSYPNFGCTASGTTSLGAPDQFTNFGPGLNLSLSGGGTVAPIHEVTFSFSQPVCGFVIRLRDLSWYDGTTNTIASGRDAVYFSQAPVIRDDSVGTNMGGLLGDGLSSGTAIRRSIKGLEPVNGSATQGWYSDAMLVFGQTSSITMTYFNASATDASGSAVASTLPTGKTGFIQVKFARILI